MKVSSENRDGIIIISVTPEENDDRGACLWLRVYLDPTRGQMLSDSDIGDYAHRWPDTGRCFLEILASMEPSYILRKCCHDRREYDADAIQRNIADYFEDFEPENEREAKERNKFLAEIANCSNVFEIQEVFYNTSFDYGDAWECISKSYTPWQKRWADYFCKFVSPEINKILRETI